MQLRCSVMRWDLDELWIDGMGAEDTKDMNGVGTDTGMMNDL